MPDHEREALEAELAYEVAQLKACDEAMAILLPVMTDDEMTVEEALALLEPEAAEKVRAGLPEYIKVPR